MATCWHCHQNIVFMWSMTGEGKAIPFDPSPDSSTGTARRHTTTGPDGRTKVYAEFLTADALHTALADGDLLWTPHRNTCNAFRPHNPKPPGLEINLPTGRTGRRRKYRA